MSIRQLLRRINLRRMKGIELGLPVVHLGKITVRMVGNGKARIGKSFSCRDDILLNVSSGELLIGEDVFINDGVKINCRKKVEIGNNVIIGQNVLIYDHDHDISAGLIGRRNAFKEREVIIGDNVWIGSNVTLLCGSIIEAGSVIGAGTVVKGNVPKNTIIYSANNIVTKRIEE